MIDELDITKARAFHGVLSSGSLWELHANPTVAHPRPVARGIASANLVIHIVNVHNLHICTGSDDFSKMLKIFRPIVDISDISDENVVPPETLRVILNISSLKKTLNRQVSRVWVGFQDNYHRHWEPLSNVSMLCYFQTLAV